MDDLTLATTSLSLPVRAVLLGDRLETRGLERDDTISTTPLTLRLGEKQIAVLFRYGVAVFAGMSAIEEDEVIRSLGPRIIDPQRVPERDSVQVTINSGADDQVGASGNITLKDASPDRLQIVANVLSKSVVLAHYEGRIANAFDRIEPLASRLRQQGRSGSQARELLRQIGDVLLTQHRMVGRVEIEEKPDVLWDHPELERLYARLEDEYELRERSHAMERKLSLVNETVGMLIDLVQDQRSLRLEWYILALIAVEILLSLYQIISPALH